MRWSTIRRIFHFFLRPTAPSKSKHLIDGARGERVAAKFLRRSGHRILFRNFSCAMGDLDLVTRHDDTIVFVEVKARKDQDAQDPMETVTSVKWSRVERAARQFVSQHRLEEFPCRFDLVTIVWNDATPTVEHIENAYEPRRP